MCLLLFVVACGDDDSSVPDLSLTSLAVSSGTLTPAFDRTVAVYTVSVSNAVSSITIAGAAVDTNAVVTYDPA